MIVVVQPPSIAEMHCTTKWEQPVGTIFINSSETTKSESALTICQGYEKQGTSSHLP